MVIFELLNKSSAVADFQILAYERWEKGYYIKIIAELVDSSQLFIREYIDPEERNYSYHWQKNTGELIIRWDNAPHHKELNTFPHHRHKKDSVSPSEPVTIEEVIEYIESKIV